MAHQPQYPQPQYPQPGFNIPPPQYNNAQHSVNVVVPTALGETPVRMVCPTCRNEVVTNVSTECSIPQHIACFVMFITAACLICSCLPYCITSLSNVRHECPSCKSHLGTYKRCA